MPENPTTDIAGKGLDLHELACERLFDEIPCCISIQDRDFRILESNDKFVNDFGRRNGHFCYAVYKGASEVCQECPVERTFIDGRPHTKEVVVFDKRGLPREMIVNTKPLRDNNGAIVAVMELMTDITVTKELQKRLHDSLNRYHTLFDRVPCFISVQDRDFRIMEANSQFANHFGERRGELCYRVYKQLEAKCGECPVEKTFEDDCVHCSEEVLTTNSGQQMNVIVYTSPIKNSAGETVAVMEMLTDITEVRHLQEELARVGQLVASAAHSAKNVLDGLRGGVYVTNLGFRDGDEESIKTGWDMIQRNVDRVSGMIMDMLYCARERTPRRLPVSLQQVAREVLNLFHNRAKERNVELVEEIDDTVDEIIADPKDIHSLVSNLVTNAIDACSQAEDSGKDYRVILRITTENGMAMVEIEDNGAGIDEEAKEKLFNMFYSTKGAFGTGLGLLVSHKVAKEHGGSIAVESEKGSGSKFIVRLPFQAAETENEIPRGA